MVPRYCGGRDPPGGPPTATIEDIPCEKNPWLQLQGRRCVLLNVRYAPIATNSAAQRNDAMRPRHRAARVHALILIKCTPNLDIDAYPRQAARSHNREVEHVPPYSHSNRWV